MSKKLIVFPALLKAHVDTFTRKDGVTVQAHDTSVQAAAVKPPTQADKKWHVRDPAGNVVKVFHGDDAEHKARQHMHANKGKNLAVRDVSAKSEPRLMLPKKSEAKTGSAAPAKEVNVGSEKWPMQAKSSEKLAARHDDGSTHHVGGFEPPSDGKGDHLVHHDGKSFSFTGKSGKNTKTGEASYEYAHRGDGAEHRAWVTHSGHLQND